MSQAIAAVGTAAANQRPESPYLAPLLTGGFADTEIQPAYRAPDRGDLTLGAYRATIRFTGLALRQTGPGCRTRLFDREGDGEFQWLRRDRERRRLRVSVPKRSDEIEVSAGLNNQFPPVKEPSLGPTVCPLSTGA